MVEAEVVDDVVIVTKRSVPVVVLVDVLELDDVVEVWDVSEELSFSSSSRSSVSDFTPSRVSRTELTAFELGRFETMPSSPLAIMLPRLRVSDPKRPPSPPLFN